MASGEKVIGAWNDPRLSVGDNYTRPVAKAMIEAVDAGGTVSRVVECSGSDFVVFQWIAAALVSGPTHNGQPLAKIIGMKLVTRDHAVEVYTDGRLVKRDLTAGDKTLESTKVAPTGTM